MSIRLKSYFSGTVEAAMALARKEMGDDAMLIHSRPTQPEVRHLGAYEVVFGVYPSAAEEAPEQPESKRAPKGESEPQRKPPMAESAGPQDSLAQQVADLRQEMERMVQALARQSPLELPRAPESMSADS